jgi:thiol-disulfide isomerase/thioredoxin
VAALTIGVAVAHPSANPGSGQGGSGLIPTSQRQAAPNFTGIVDWINSPPLTMRDLRGKVVLIDFWTFSCVNCVRTIPHLQALWNADRSRGLVIVGVHSPEFDFEKVPTNVKAAVKRLDVTWPVAVDSNMATWNAYGNEYWPAEYLIDQQGRVAYFHAGEGDYGATDDAAAALVGGGATPAPGPSNAAPAPGTNTTPELYAGSLRGQLGDGETYGAPNTPVQYPDTGDPRDRDQIVVSGSWRDEYEYLEATAPGHVRLRFHATDVYIVAGSATGAPVRVTVTVDGAPVPVAERGPDLGAGGASVTTSELRQLLTGIGPGDHVIDLTVPAGFQLYTFTFG